MDKEREENMVTEKMYDKLAELLVKKGANVQKDQPVVVRGSVRDAGFVRKLVKAAYEAGAKYVSVEWRDTELTKMRYEYESIETLSEVPDWQYDKTKYEHDGGACYISVGSEKPGSMAGVDSTKMRAATMANFKKMGDLRNYTTNNIGQWCGAGLPSVDWAKAVFPDLSDEEAFEKLSDAVFAVTRVSEDNDPLAEWDQHSEELLRHCGKLTEMQFSKLHFTSGLGTDLWIELVKDHVWVGGGCTTPKGVFFVPNMPTEECFCMPYKTGTNGTVYASLPLNYSGKMIKNFWLKFEDGKVVDYGAEEGKEALDQLFSYDEGSSYLGEVALVPYDSPVSKTGILFLNTLYDENAACHLALGRPYPENLRGGTEMSREELTAHGANDSMQHVDFMFGTKDMSIDGIMEDGTVEPIFRDGNFVF